MSGDPKDRLTEYLRTQEAESVRRAVEASHPKGWEPGVAWDGTRGELTTQPLPAAPTDWSDLLSIWGLDPAVHRVVEPVQFRAWDGTVRKADGTSEVTRLYYYKASITTVVPGVPHTDYDELRAVIDRHKAKPVRRTKARDRSLVVCMSDYQLGKGENGGTVGTVERIMCALDEITDKVRADKWDAVYLLGLGDLVEGCTGHYPMQEFQTDLDAREQVRVARRLIVEHVARLAPITPRLVVAAVPGNHGENRKDGKAFTTFTDNHDLAVFEQAAEICDGRPGLNRVSFHLAKELTLTVDVSGVIVGLMHGHAGRAHSADKLWKWWGAQAIGGRPIGDAQLLVSGHYHHLKIDEAGGRTWFQCPAMDGGSQWWVEATGQHSHAGVLTFGAGVGYGPRGWGDLDVIAA